MFTYGNLLYVDSGFSLPSQTLVLTPDPCFSRQSEGDKLKETAA